jgi:hypothetical protein
VRVTGPAAFGAQAGEVGDEVRVVDRRGIEDLLGGGALEQALDRDF